MLTLPNTPELERRLEEEAAKRGLEPADFVLLMLEDLMAPASGDQAEAARLAAASDFMGLGLEPVRNASEL